MTDHAQIAYDAFAPIYDEFNSQNDYRSWMSVLVPKLKRLGLAEEGRLLDVACGTGRSFEAMQDWATETTACDISPLMVAVAEEKHRDLGVRFDVADMRELPVYEPDGFQLVWALNDPVNYLLEDGDLRSALESMGRNLAEDGLIVFDLNSLALMCSCFLPEGGLDRGEDWQWKGLGRRDDGTWEAELSGVGVETHMHRERHYPVQEVQSEIINAGLEPVAAMGQSEDETGITIEDGWDEERDVKIVHVARRRRRGWHRTV